MSTLLLALACQLAARNSEDLPGTLAAPFGESKDQGDEGRFSFGFRLGAVHVPDADEATWTASVAFRGGLGSLLAFELASAYYSVEFDEGDVVVVPLQASALFFPLPDSRVTRMPWRG